MLSGRVKVFKLTPSGRQVILEILGPGDPVGFIAAHEDRPYPASAKVFEPAVCLRIRRGAFFALVEQHPSIVLGLLSGLNVKLVEFTNRIAELSWGRVESRLARLFLRFCDDLGKKRLSPSPPEWHQTCSHKWGFVARGGNRA